MVDKPNELVEKMTTTYEEMRVAWDAIKLYIDVLDAALLAATKKNEELELEVKSLKASLLHLRIINSSGENNKRFFE